MKDLSKLTFKELEQLQQGLVAKKEEAMAKFDADIAPIQAETDARIARWKVRRQVEGLSDLERVELLEALKGGE